MRTLQTADLIPACFVVEGVSIADDVAVVAVRASASAARCPSCATGSRRVHSRYARTLRDLPMAGRRVCLSVSVRRFFCDARTCRRTVFAERFDDFAAPHARRTSRLEALAHCLAIALGGRPAARLAQRLSVEISNDTLLRVVRRRKREEPPVPSIIGIDDWAWRRNHRYGTLVCDLERRKTIALLPDREPATAEAWMAHQPQIAVVARDRGGGYAIAARRALPDAVQVADRWHLMQNASQALLGAVRKSMRQVRAAIGAATINPELLTCAEKLQYEGYLRREEANDLVLALANQSVAIKEIVRRTGHSRGLVREILRRQRSDVFRTRQSSLEPYLPWLDAQWAAGGRNGAAMWRGLRSQGFRGCLGVVSEWVARRKRAERADFSALARAPSARTIARLLSAERDQLTKSETVTIAAIESSVTTLTEARDVIAEFHELLRRRSLSDLDGWIDRARKSIVAAFANGVMKDRAAVEAAITSPWSNGQTEGQICKLKLVKRQMFGRGKIDLLQARVIGFANA